MYFSYIYSNANRSRLVGKGYLENMMFLLHLFFPKLSFQAYVGTDDKLKFTHKGNIRPQLA